MSHGAEQIFRGAACHITSDSHVQTFFKEFPDRSDSG